MITEIEQITSDIDWFFTNGEKIGFVASGSGRLPDSISRKNMEEIMIVSDYFRELTPTSKSVINPQSKKLITPGTNKNEYYSYFAQMAEKGLFSFDKTTSNRFSDTNYLLVASPSIPLKLTDLPSEIANILLETKIEGNIGEDLDVCCIS